MNWRNLTIMILIATVAGLIGWDVFVIAKAGKYASISEIVIESAYNFPMIPFLAGFICGHLFWRMPDVKKGDE